MLQGEENFFKYAAVIIKYVSVRMSVSDVLWRILLPPIAFVWQRMNSLTCSLFWQVSGFDWNAKS